MSVREKLLLLVDFLATSYDEVKCGELDAIGSESLFIDLTKLFVTTSEVTHVDMIHFPHLAEYLEWLRR
jgi:hypothetical protein